MQRAANWTGAVVLLAATGCYSGLAGLDIGGDDPPEAGSDGDDIDDTPPGDDDLEPGELASHSGLRRLTVNEFDNALRDLLGDEARAGEAFLPTDPLAPFDNAYEEQSPSETLIAGVEKLASDAAARLLADPGRLAEVVGCSPTEIGESECLREFIVNLGRRAFRRPLEDAEVERFVALQDVADTDGWNGAIAVVVRAMLQDPNFLYRVEIGEPIPGNAGVFRLTDWEVATRLSFFLWGSIPDDALLDAAAAGALSNREAVQDQAELMLADPKARATIERFHAMWLGYSAMGEGGLGRAMLDESRSLIGRVVFEDDQRWLALLTSEETYITPELAAHYGLPSPGASAGWVPYGDSGRGGVLSHGTVLALGAKFEDTSPTSRGLAVRERLLCQTLETPDDLEVDVDEPPGADPDDCKLDRYQDIWETSQGCAACHKLTDGIGFGLENYDASGAFREHDVGKPECEISGDGEVAEIGPFNGPGELGQLLADSPTVRRCAIQQLVGFANGRSKPDTLDAEVIDTLDDGFDGGELHLRELLVALAGSAAFRFRALDDSE